MNEDERHRSGQNLKTLLRKAHLTSASFQSGQRLVAYPGTYRDWTFGVALSDDWLTVGGYVCAVPTAANLRADLYDAILRANQTMSLIKFSVAEQNVRIEAEYRAEHIDAEVVSNILGLLLSTAEEHYPRLFRIASGDALLHTLAQNSALSSPE